MSERPVLVGHRGGAGTRAIENTVPAFLDGYEHGLRHLEVDVRLTGDEQVVVFHDPTLRRATDGSSQKDERLLSQMTLSDLRQVTLRYGSSQTGRIPTLAEAFAALPSDVHWEIELKSLFADIREGIEVLQDDLAILRNPERLVDAVWRVVVEAGRSRQVRLTSFSPLLLRTAHANAPEAELGLLVSPIPSADLVRQVLAVAPGFLSIAVERLQPSAGRAEPPATELARLTATAGDPGALAHLLRPLWTSLAVDLAQFCHCKAVILPRDLAEDSDLVARCGREGLLVSAWTALRPEHFPPLVAAGVDEILLDDAEMVGV